MKSVGAALLLSTALLGQNAFASLVHYKIDFEIAEFQGAEPIPELYPGTGRATFDSQRKSIIGLTLDSELYSFDWSGNEPLNYSVSDYPPPGDAYHPTVTLYSGDASVYFDFDVIIAESDTELVYNFAHMEHEIEWSQEEESFWGYASLVKIPEPPTMALLALGLMGFAVLGGKGRRQYS